MTDSTHDIAANSRSATPLDAGGEARKAALAKSKKQIDAQMFRDALRTVNKARALWPGDVSLKIRKAVVLRHLQRWRESASVLREILKQRPKADQARFELAVTCRAMGAYDRSLAHLRKIPQDAAIRRKVVLATIETQIKMQAFEAALATSEQALSTQADDEGVLIKKAVVLRHMGRFEESDALLQGILDQTPGAAPALLERAILYRTTSQYTDSLACLRTILKTDPQHRKALLQTIETLIQMQAYAAALDSVAQALKARPKDLAVGLKQALIEERLNQPLKALETLAQLHRLFPKDTRPGLARAKLCLATHGPAAAEAEYAAILEAHPDHAAARMGRIDILLQQNEMGLALAQCDALIEGSPHLPLARIRKASALQRIGHHTQAIEVLEAARQRFPENIHLWSEVAQAYFLAGRFDASDDIYAQCIQAAPQDHQLVLKRASNAEACGDMPRAIALLQDQLDSHFDPARADSLPDVFLLKYCELVLQNDQKTPVTPLLEYLAGRTCDMADTALMRLFFLGEHVQYTEASVAVVQEISKRDVLSLQLAQLLLRRAHMVLPPEEVSRLAQAFERKLPQEKQAEFRIRASLLQNGPDAALEIAKTQIPAPRGFAQASVIGGLLLETGKTRLAMRYFQFATKRWPTSAFLRSQFLRACIETGHIARAYAVLEDVTQANPGLDVGLDHFELLIAENQLEPAIRMAEERKTRGLKAPAPFRLFAVYLALGWLEQAAALRPAVRGAPRNGRQTVSHFNTTLFGAQFNELQLCVESAAHLEASGHPPETAQQALARSFYLPASQIVDTWMQQHGNAPVPAKTDAPIPQNIFQYWNSNDIPDEVQQVMASWEAPAGFTHRCFNRSQAITFLRNNFGPKYVRAFMLANSVTEECDFLRLCLLFKHGGIYADADDRLISDPAQLLAQGNGMIVVREHLGSIANNVICAQARHPVLKHAINMAGQSLLSKENDGTWSKTGPGLMTRAVALYLTETSAGDAQQNLHIMGQSTLGHFVQPHVRLAYKSTAQHWNAKDSRLSHPLIAAFAEVV